MSTLNGILSSALTGLQVSQTALSTVSNNVSNINTPGYTRRVVNTSALVSGGTLSGVEVADIQRVADQFLNQELLTSQASSSQATAVNNLYTQLNGLLGSPGDGSALTTKLDDVVSALSTAAPSPTSGSNQSSVLTAFQNLASTISSLSTTVTGLRDQADQQVSSSIASVNTLLQQIYEMNNQIQTATIGGDDASGVLDQRDAALQKLSQLIGVKTTAGTNGQLIVSTPDGVQLVGDTYGQLSYTGGTSNGTYSDIQLTTINPSTGQSIGQPISLDPHMTSGKLVGLIGMRDGALADFQKELDSFAQQTSSAFNAVSNANAAYPPPTTLSGRDTGLLSSDSLGFSGKTTIGVADSSGKLVSRIDVDFGAGTLSVDGGAAVSIGSTVGSFTTALNSALGANGSASFANGQLTINGSGTNGIVVQDDATTPSSRAGTGFSQFFGLNDIFRTSVPSIAATGLSSSDAGGFAAGGTIDLTLTGTNGQTKTASVTLTGSETIGNIVTALNTAFGGAATFSLGSNGALAMTPSASFSGGSISVNSDSTQRGSTGMSFTELFGLGRASGTLSSGFSVNSSLVSNPASLPFATPGITSATVAGDAIVTSGDATGLTALQNVASTKQTFAAAGGLAAQNATLSDYAASFYQDVAVRASSASDNSTTQSDRLTEAQKRQSAVSGVNLDEELTNLVSYQKAYSASAHILQTVQTLYDTLLQIQ